MGLSTNTYTYSGSKQFAATFADGYIEQDHVKAYVEGSVDGLGNQVFLSFTWTSESQITVTDPLFTGNQVTVERTVPKTNLLVDLDENGAITREGLARNARQAMHAVHEVMDGRLDISLVTTVNNLVAKVAELDASVAASAASASSAATSAVAAAVAAATAAQDANPYASVSRNAIEMQALYDRVDDYAVVYVEGHKYRKRVGVTGVASCTNDIGLDGWVPFGKVHVEHYGGKVDDAAVDNGAAANRLYVNHGVLHSEAEGTYYTSTCARNSSNGAAKAAIGSSKYLTRWEVTSNWPAGMQELNGNNYTVTVVDVHSFQLDGVNSTAFAAYSDGGVAVRIADNEMATYKRIIGASNATTCVVDCPNHGYSTGDTIRIEAVGGKPIFWFGNSTGHGNSRNEVRGMRLNCEGRATGVRLQEGGTSSVQDMHVTEGLIGIDVPGAISTDVYRNDVYICDIGICGTSPVSASNAPSLDDVSRTDGPLTIKPNMSKYDFNWIRGGKIGIIAAGSVHATRNTFQAVGTDPFHSQCVFQRATESLNYGGGASFIDNWTESGIYKATLEIVDTREVIVERNRFFGSSARNYEWFVLASDNSSGLKLIRNSFLFRGDATPTQGRAQTGYVYSLGRHLTTDNNHYTQRGTFNDDELFVFDRSPTGMLTLMDAGQNNGSAPPLQLSGIEISQGSAVTVVQPNTKRTGTNRVILSGMEISNCDITNIAFGSTVTMDSVNFTNGKRIRSTSAYATAGTVQRGDWLIIKTPTPGNPPAQVVTTGGTMGSTAVAKDMASLAV